MVRRTLGDLPLARLRNTGIVPGGSMITNSVMNTSPNSFAFTAIRTLAAGYVTSVRSVEQMRWRRAHRVLLVVGAARADSARSAGQVGQGGWFRGVVDLRPLPPVERRTGP